MNVEPKQTSEFVKISVIVPAYNAADTIADCLVALQKQTRLPDEIIVVDDGSTDETAQVVERLGIRLIRQAHAGAAAARNVGARLASGDILVFTDADCRPEPDWLLRLIQPFDDSEIVGSKGVYRTTQSSLVARFVQLEYESKYANMVRQSYIDFVDTYSAAYRRDVFLQNSGFDTKLLELEDQEFSFRLARKGYRMVFVPSAVVYHIHDRNVFEYIRRKYEIGYWKAFILRWLPEKLSSDSHTPASQRWQIVLLGLAGIFIILVPISPYFVWLALGSSLIFYLTALPLFKLIALYDPAVLWIAPLLLLCRAAAQGVGLLSGFLFPPTVYTSKGLGFSARFFKRALDIVGALIGLVLSAPIILLAAVAIKMDSPGPVFFIQKRVGENGRVFRMLKLRTMIYGAEHQVQMMMHSNRLSGPVFKIPNDPRVTRVGRVLRRWSIDELPQFWNVLRGEMSLVGPRPEETWIVAQYNDQQRQRLVVKPGMTGPMQISGRGELDMDARLKLELDYIEHYSIWKDLEIILRTIPAVLSGRGAF